MLVVVFVFLALVSLAVAWVLKYGTSTLPAPAVDSRDLAPPQLAR